MNKFYLTPGPSQLYHSVNDHVREALKIGLPSWSHRGKDFCQVYSNTRKALFSLLEVPDSWEVVFVGSATEVWERLIQNFVSKRSLHVITGAFSERVAGFSDSMGFATQNVHIRETEAFDPNSLPVESSPELITLAGNETSTGYWISDPLVRKLRKRSPNTVLALDLVSALPHYQVPFEDIDCFYFSVQKGFGLPAGLGVLVYNKELLSKVVDSKIAPYRSFRNLHEMAQKDQTLATPNMLDIYLLGKVCEDMNNRGVGMIRSETNYKAALLKKAIQDSDGLEDFVPIKEFQSPTSLVAKTKNASRIIETMGKKGFVLGSGYGKYKGEHIRIANFPSHSKELFESLVDNLTGV